MKRQYSQSGFTILEVVLFVTISGLLMAMLMTGWSTMVNRQEYRDSQLAVQTYLQQQYNLVQNVENGRVNDLACAELAGATKVNPGSEKRGQSNCVLLGRLIVLKNGTTYNSYAVVGKDVEASPAIASDIEAIKAALPSVVTEDIGLSTQKKVVPWQGIVSVGTANSPTVPMDSAIQSVAILIARSPISGAIHTYRIDISNETSEKTLAIKDLITTSTGPMVMCIESGLPLSGDRLGVKIDQNAASQSGISLISGSDEGCL